jgi:iron complex outermembrane receptor protein
MMDIYSGFSGRRSLRPATLFLVAVLLAVESVQAELAAGVLEEVLVVAQRRTENLQEIPIAVTALQADALDALNIVNTSDFEAVVPSLSIRDAPRRLFIRGIGRATNSLGTEPGIAVYTDQVYNSEPTLMGVASSLTMERIEILRGPQGTLYGRNATGGAVNVITKRPTEDFEHHLRAKAGDYDLFNWGAASSGPITDELGYRVYAYRDKRDGYIENKGGSDLWDEDHDGWGAQLNWDLSDEFNIWLSYRSSEADDMRTGIIPGEYLITPYVTDVEVESSLILREGYLWDKENPAVEDPYTVDLNDPLRAETYDSNNYTAHITWDIPAATLKYIGNYNESKYKTSNGDYGYTSREDIRLVHSVSDSFERYSHELQLLSAVEGPLQWVAGLYYFHSERDQPFGIRNLEAGYLANVSPTGSLEDSRPNPGLWAYHQTADLKSESMAIYGDANYSFNEAWKLTAGLRYSYDEKEGEESRLIAVDIIQDPSSEADCCGLLFSDPEDNARELDDDWDNVSGRAVLEYMPDDGHLLYASVATGYKAGGIRLGTIDDEPHVDEETVLSYEFGYKSSFSENLQINAAAFFYDYQDMQVMVSRLVEGSAGFSVTLPQMANADEAEVKGVEIEAVWLPSASLSLMANYSYTDGEYTDFCCHPDEKIYPPPDPPQLEDLSGNPMIQTPKNKFFVNASYALQTTSFGEFVPSVSYSWVDERQFDVFDTDATLADDYYRLDAMVTWFSPTESIRVIASGRNLTDKQTWTSLSRGSFNEVYGHINEPRTWAMEVQYDF